MKAYYNEHDPFAAQWLRNLITAGHIAPGDVDEMSIEDVRPYELAGYTQCHFFAGIGGWSYALRLAGWPDDRPVWTGSCPCQPFSAAGKGAGVTDERHLWSAWHHLIRQCRPPVIFGEQVEAAINHEWLDLVQTDLEGEGYAVGAVGLPAAGIGAPHIRQRLWFVAERLGYASGTGLSERISDGRIQRETVESSPRQTTISAGDLSRMADAASEQHNGSWIARTRGWSELTDRSAACWSDAPDGFWRVADWLYCRDGKWRPTQPGIQPLAPRIPKGMVRGSDTSMAPDADQSQEGRVMRLKGYGNSIVPQCAKAFIEAYVSVRP